MKTTSNKRMQNIICVVSILLQYSIFKYHQAAKFSYSANLLTKTMPEGAEVHHGAKVLGKAIKGMWLEEMILVGTKPLKPLVIGDLSETGTTTTPPSWGASWCLSSPVQVYHFRSFVKDVFATGKRFVIMLESGVHIVVSLRMTGKFMVGKERKHTRAILNLFSKSPTLSASASDNSLENKEEKTEIVNKVTNNELKVYYDDMRPLSEADIFATGELFWDWRVKNLGWDPLARPDHINTVIIGGKVVDVSGPLETDKGMNVQKAKLLLKRKGKIANVIADQKIFAGVGNYVRAEVLYQSNIDPRRLANTLTDKEIAKMLDCIKRILRASLRLGGHTIESFCDPLGDQGHFKPRCYGQQYTMDALGWPVERIKGGQSIYWCPFSQF